MGNESDVEQQLTEDANRRAGAMPLPGALSEAFLNDAIKVTDNILVRRIVASDWKIMQALDSPLYRSALEAQKDEKIRDDVTYTDEETSEMCWQFTHTPKQCRELLAKGRDEFRRVAVEEMGDNHPAQVIEATIKAITAQVVNSGNTRILYGSDSEGSKKN